MASSKMILHDTGQKVINQTANKYLSSEQVLSQFPHLSCHRLPRKEVEHSRELAGSASNSVRPALPTVWQIGQTQQICKLKSGFPKAWQMVSSQTRATDKMTSMHLRSKRKATRTASTQQVTTIGKSSR
jgi:hypothetical protein